VARVLVKLTNDEMSSQLVDGFNPLEKICSSNWIISLPQTFGVKIKNHKKSVKTTT